jgi:ribosomal protein S18 acetylase RimI-like enzyme
MIRATHKHREVIIEILTKSFYTNSSVNYVIRQDAKRRERIRGLMEYSLMMCTAFGEVWLSDDEKACSLILLPDRKKITLRTILWDIKLAFYVTSFSNVKKILKRESMIKANHPKEPFCYLWFIGVEPEYQAKGIGSSLLKSIIKRFDEAGRPIYLETSVESNLSWYKKFGFEVFHTLQLSYQLHLLRRPTT